MNPGPPGANHMFYNWATIPVPIMRSILEEKKYSLVKINFSEEQKKSQVIHSTF